MSLMAIFDSDQEFCAPIYSDLQDAAKVHNSIEVISIPNFSEEGQLLFTI